MTAWLDAAESFDRRPVSVSDLDAMLEGLTTEELELLAREVEDDLRAGGRR